MTTFKSTQVTVLRGGRFGVPKQKQEDIIVLKCGGSTLDTLSDRFYQNIKQLQESGLKPIIVHGGGPAIEEALKKEKIKTEFVNGLRKTTQPVMEVVEMVLTGKINNAVTRKLNQKGIQAVGLSGSDMGLLSAKPIDMDLFGYVGEVTNVNTPFLWKMLDQGVVPVIAPIGLGEDNTILNINADTAAGAVAKAVGAKQLIFVTDVPGILKDEKLLYSVTETEVEQMIASGVIYGGMIPKVKAALDSLSDDLQEAMITDGSQTVLSTSQPELVGTVIKRSVGVDEHVCTFSNV